MTLESILKAKNGTRDVLEDRRGRFWLGPAGMGETCGGASTGPRCNPVSPEGGARARAWRPRSRPGSAAREWGGRGSAPGFSPLSPWVSARGSAMKHFLPLCHGAPPSVAMQALAARLFLRDPRWKGSALLALPTRMQPFLLPDGKGREGSGRKPVPNLPRARWRAPAMPLAPGWKRGVPWRVYRSGLRPAAALRLKRAGGAGVDVSNEEEKAQSPP